MTPQTSVRATSTDSAPRRAAGVIWRRLDTPFRHPVALAALGLLWGLLGWLRMTPAAHGTIWAEDGRDFLAEASQSGPLGALLIPYAGYMHLLPRTIAGIVSQLPVDWWAQGMSAVSCLFAGLAALVVYCVTARLPIAPWGRLLLASITVLAPTLIAEVIGNAANMYTFALWVGLWLFLWRPTRWATAVVGGVIALLVAGTAIQIVALVPLLAFRWSRRRLPVAIGVLAGLVLQAYAYTHSIRLSQPSWPRLGTINDGYFHQVGFGSWIESAHVGAVIILVLGWIAATVFFVPYLIATVLLWRVKTDRTQARLLTIVLLGGSYVYWFAFFALNNLAIDYAKQSPIHLVLTGTTLRYAVFPSMLLWALIVLAISWHREPSAAPQRWRRVQVVAATVLLVCAAVNFVGLGTTIRTRGPEWSQSLEKARAECASEAPSTPVALSISPVHAPWFITLSCRVVDSDG